jgi:hypothetical protein
MLKYYEQIMNPKKKQKNDGRGDFDRESNTPGFDSRPPGGPSYGAPGLLPDPIGFGGGVPATSAAAASATPATSLPKKRPWEVRHEKMEKSFNPDLEKVGLPTSFGKRKQRD